MTTGTAASRPTGVAAVLAVGVVQVVAIVVTVSAAIVARRTGRDLAWVPLVSTALVVAGYLAAVAVFDAVMR